jgi:hypothetical protein
MILRGNGGKPIRLCGSLVHRRLAPVPSTYSLNCTLITQGVLSTSPVNARAAEPNYYGCWINTNGESVQALNVGSGGTVGVSSRQTCSYDAKGYDTVAASLYGSLDPTAWAIYVEGTPASNRTYSGSGGGFDSGAGVGAHFSQGYIVANQTNGETRTGIYIYMNKNLTAAELASVSADIYQLFETPQVPLFFDYPKQAPTLPSLVPYSRRPTNSSDGFVKVSKRYKTKFAVSASAGLVELVTGTKLSQELVVPLLQIRRVAGKYPGLAGNPNLSGVGGLQSQVMVPLRKSMTIAFCLTTKPSQQATIVMGSLPEFNDDPAYASSFAVYVDPSYEHCSLIIGLSDASLNATHIYEAVSSINISVVPAETTGMYAFEITEDGRIRSYANGLMVNGDDVPSVDFLFPDVVGSLVNTLSLVSSNLLGQGLDVSMLHAVVITEGRDGAALTRNIWDAFEGVTDLPTFSPHTPVVPLQTALPAIDTATGAWMPSTGSTLYETLDEVTADDSDYILTDVATTCEIKVSALTDPLSNTDHSVTYRLLPGIGNITAALKCGAVTIATWGPHILTGATQEFTQVLTTSQADSITDYSDIRVVFTSS